MDEEMRLFLADVKALLPTGDIPEYVFRMVELVSEADKAISDAWERARLADVTISETKETIRRLEEENARLREVNISALLNQSGERKSEPEKKEEVEEKEKIKTIEEIKKEGVDI